MRRFLPLTITPSFAIGFVDTLYFSLCTALFIRFSSITHVTFVSHLAALLLTPSLSFQRSITYFASFLHGYISPFRYYTFTAASRFDSHHIVTSGVFFTASCLIVFWPRFTLEGFLHATYLPLRASLMLLLAAWRLTSYFRG